MGLFDESWPFTKPEQAVSNQKTAAEKNRINILGLIARRHGLSQRQLTLATGLRASTIYNIVSELKNLGLVREGAAIKAERVGPKETELEIVPECLWCAGLSIDARNRTLTILDAGGRTLLKENLPPAANTEALIASACLRIQSCASDLGLEQSKLGGAVVTVPGVVDPTSGTILTSHALQLHSFAMGELMQKHLSCPVWVERDVASGAYAEHNIGEAEGLDSFIYFWLRTVPSRMPHFGLSLVINEKIFRGCNSAAGEIGNLFGFTSGHESLRQAVITEQTADVFYQSLSSSLANIVNLLDIRSVVLASNEQHLSEERFARLIDQTEEQLVPIAGRQFTIKRSKLGLEGIAGGCALLALHRALAHRLSNVP